MKLPVYESQVRTPNAPQFSAMADARAAGNLGDLANNLNQYRQFRQAELEEAQKTEWFKADNGFKMDVLRARTEMVNSIQNGGAYADAEDKFQKTFDDAKAKYMPFFADDENISARQAVEFERAGLEGLLTIREAVQQRRKSDAVQASDMVRSEAEGMFLSDPAKAIDMYSSTLAGLQGVGAISSDGAKARLAEFVQGGKAREMELVFQNNRDNPQVAADWVEANQSDLNPDVYLSGRDRAQVEIYKFGSAQKVKNYLADPVAYKAPEQESVDVFYDRDIAPIAQTSVADYEEATISLSVSTGKLPQQVANQAASYLDMDPALMSQQDMQTAASNARIISETNKYAAKLSKTNLSKDTIAKADLLVQRMNAGMPVDKALMSMQRDLGTEEGKKLYSASITEARNILLEKKLNGSMIRVDVPTYAQADFIQAYATAKMNTAKASEAAKLAEDEIANRYKSFNGVLVKDPATSVSFYDEESWVKASTAKYIEKIGPLEDGQKTVVIADSETKRLIQAGEKPSFPLFLSYSKNEPPIPVFDKQTGQPIRIYEDPTAMKTIKKKVFSKGSGMRTYRVRVQNAN